MADAAAALDIPPVHASTVDMSSTIAGACTGTPDPWVIVAGGLTLFFEDFDGSADTAFLTNWNYTGGPVGRFTEMIAPRGIGVGSTRQDIAAAYPEVEFIDDSEIFIVEPVNMRFAMSGDTVQWFGIVDCVFEGQEPAPDST
jgi:hypothetical protein